MAHSSFFSSVKISSDEIRFLPRAFSGRDFAKEVHDYLTLYDPVSKITCLRDGCVDVQLTNSDDTRFILRKLLTEQNPPFAICHMDDRQSINLDVQPKRPCIRNSKKQWKSMLGHIPMLADADLQNVVCVLHEEGHPLKCMKSLCNTLTGCGIPVRIIVFDPLKIDMSFVMASLFETGYRFLLSINKKGGSVGFISLYDGQLDRKRAVHLRPHQAIGVLVFRLDIEEAKPNVLHIRFLPPSQVSFLMKEEKSSAYSEFHRWFMDDVFRYQNEDTRPMSPKLGPLTTGASSSVSLCDVHDRLMKLEDMVHQLSLDMKTLLSRVPITPVVCEDWEDEGDQ